MKRLFFIILLGLTIGVTACKSTANENPSNIDASVLLVSDGEHSKTYIVEDLQTLPSAQASFKGVAYIGVTLSVLLKDAGFDPTTIQAVKATANDGFSSNYNPDLFNKPDTLVSYARVDGALSPDEGIFRMVIPGDDGKVNVRQLVSLQIYQ